MDNEYNYNQLGESEEPEEPKTYYNTGYNAEYNMGSSQEPKPVRQKMKAPKVVRIIGAAVVFGLVASVVFQAANVVGSKVLGTNTTKTSAKIGSTELTKTSGGSTAAASDVAQVVNNAMPSVVSITNMSLQQVQNFFGGVSEQESESSGSGIIIAQNDSELLILTNNHVIEGSDTLTVSFIDEESVEAQIKGTDAEQDLAVVAVPISSIKNSTMDEIKVATLGDSSKLNAGDSVIAIGNALGYGQSVTTGVVSATNRTLEGYSSNLIQTDAAINPGNSGGALLNVQGEVVGINSAKVNADAVEGMGYAIPISDVSDTITNLMNQETKAKVAESEKGYLGIKGVDVTAESSKMYSMPTGVYVSEAISGGGAEAAGITKGSVITALAGTTIDSMATLQEQLQYYKAGETVKITIQTPEKNGEYKEQTVEVVLGKSA